MIIPEAQRLLDLMRDYAIPLVMMVPDRIIDYESLPIPRMQHCVIQYIELGIIDPDDFLWFLVTNNLKETYQVADIDNAPRVQEWVTWFHNKVPSLCWGSEENVAQWCKSRQPYYSQYLSVLKASDA